MPPQLLGEGDQQNGVRDRDADGHDGPHERLHIQGRPRDGEHQHHTHERRGDRRHDDEGQTQRLEIGGEQQKDHDHRDQQPGADIRERLAHRIDLAAHAHRRSARRRARARDRLIDAIGDPSEILARRIRRERDHALTVESIVFTDDGAVLDIRDVAEQGMRCAVRRDRYIAEVFDRGHLRLRYFHLHLEGDPGARVGPIIRRDKPA